MKKFWVLFIFFALSFSQAEAGLRDILASGGWSTTISATDLTAGAGSNIGDKESNSNATLLDVSATGYSYKVDINRDNASWNANLSLYLKRTSGGTSGSGFVAGGTTYTLVGTSSSTFFTGTGSRSGIAVQYKLAHRWPFRPETTAPRSPLPFWLHKSRGTT